MSKLKEKISKTPTLFNPQFNQPNPKLHHSHFPLNFTPPHNNGKLPPFYQQILQILNSYLKINLVLLPMSEIHQGRSPRVFSIQVSGIRCTNCAAKIKKALTERLSEADAKIGVNIMQEKVSLTVFKEHSAYQAVQILKEIGFPPIGEPVAVSGGDQAHRSIAFLIDSSEQNALPETLSNMLGVVRCTTIQGQGTLRLNVIYNCEIVKGREIADVIEQTDPHYKVINDRIDSFSKSTKKVEGEERVAVTIILSLYLLFANMILPVLPFTKEWYKNVDMFPQAWGVYSLTVIINVIITIYVMIAYARGFIVRAFKNYMEFHVTNMETLIALGSMSAFSLFIFFVIRYSIEYGSGELNDPEMIGMAIMDINQALTSASIIVLVVTVGKYFQGEVKKKISKLTEAIFPESTLFENMRVSYVEIKNRQLVILNEKDYDVSLIEKNDILRANPGRSLVDSIVISGSMKAKQSARTGCEDIIELGKGDRLESGAEILEVTNCLIIVENVLEKSLLIEIGTQIKLAQNQEQSEESGIQAVCKTISSYFVKGVIILSLLTILVWSLLLFFNAVVVPMCDVCWVVERGIGVLVASCPCALGLAVPSVMAIILNLATKSGVLIKNNGIFEKMKKTKKIAFDKTGTLFTRINKIQEYKQLSKMYEPTKFWEMIAIIQKEIRHPLAEILYKVAFENSKVVGTNYSFILLEKPKVQKQGISAKLLDKALNKPIDVLIGNKSILTNYQIPVPQFQRNSDASTELYLTANEEVLMVIMLNTHSNLRPEAKDVVTKLRKQGMEVHILSGDSAESVEKLGEYLEIPFECLHPEQSAFMKMKWIKDNQEDGEHVIMIGDGLNDIPCLQEAGIGISINAKSELNINAADVVILSENLYKILALIRFLKKGNLFIKLNLFWAFAYNIVIMPIVAGVFFHWDIFVSPVWSSIAMSGSSLFVVAFSHLLSCFSYDDSFQEGITIINKSHSIRYSQEPSNSSREIISHDETQNCMIRGGLTS